MEVASDKIFLLEGKNYLIKVTVWYTEIKALSS